MRKVSASYPCQKPLLCLTFGLINTVLFFGSTMMAWFSQHVQGRGHYVIITCLKNGGCDVSRFHFPLVEMSRCYVTIRTEGVTVRRRCDGRHFCEHLARTMPPHKDRMAVVAHINFGAKVAEMTPDYGTARFILLFVYLQITIEIKGGM